MTRERRVARRMAAVVPADKEIALIEKLAQWGDGRRASFEQAVTTRAQYAHNVLTQVNPTIAGYDKLRDSAVALLTEMFEHTRGMVAFVGCTDSFVPEFSDALRDVEDTVAAAEAAE